MEPDVPLTTACTDDGVLSLLALTAVDDVAAVELASLGQNQRWRRVHLCALLSLVLIDALVCGARCCAGAELVSVGPAARVDTASKPVCEGCGTRLTRCKGKLHRSGAGKICHCCYMNASRRVDAIR